jgi:uncharacterized membrane protein
MQRRNTWLTAAIAIGILIIAATSFALNIPGLGKYKKVTAVNGIVTIPASSLDDGKARFYSFKDGGTEIRFFLVKDRDGSIKSAFDACDVCYKDKKGYEQSGDQMLCKNCNKKFAISRIGPHAVGGCNPSYLPSTSNGKEITIKASDIQAGARYF